MLDLYGRPFNFQMMHGFTTHRSIAGSVLSIILYIVALVYAVNRLQVLINHEQSKVTIWQEENSLDEFFEFNVKENKFNFAYGLFYNTWKFNPVSAYDEDYGSFHLATARWDTYRQEEF